MEYIVVVSRADRRSLRRLGSKEEIHHGLMKFRDDVNLLESLRPKLTKEYPNKWVALYEGEVVDTADSLENLLRVVDRKGLPRDGVVTQFLSTEKITMTL